MGNLCLCFSPRRKRYVRDVKREWEYEFNMINMPYSNCVVVKTYFDKIKTNPLLVYVLYGRILQCWGLSDAPYIARIFAQYDTHGTGRVSFRTFLLICWNITTLDKHLMEHFMFELYDEDHDGYLPTAAISQMINDIYASDAVNNQTVQEAERELKQIGQYTLTDLADFRKFLHDHKHLFDRVMEFRDVMIKNTTHKKTADFWMWQEQWRKAHCHVNKKEYMCIRELLGKPPGTTEADDEVDNEVEKKKRMENRLVEMKTKQKPVPGVHPDPDAEDGSLSNSRSFGAKVMVYKGTMGEIKAASDVLPDRESKHMAVWQVADTSSGFKMPGKISDTSIAPKVKLIAPPTSTNWHPKRVGHEHEHAEHDINEHGDQEHHHHHHEKHHHHHHHDKHDHGNETGNTEAVIAAAGGHAHAHAHTHTHTHTHDVKMEGVRASGHSGAASPVALASPVGSPRQPHKRFGHKPVDTNEGKDDGKPKVEDGPVHHHHHHHHHKKSTLAAEKDGKVMKPEHGPTAEKADSSSTPFTAGTGTGSATLSSTTGKTPTSPVSLHLSDSAAKYAADHSYHKDTETNTGDSAAVADATTTTVKDHDHSSASDDHKHDNNGKHHKHHHHAKDAVSSSAPAGHTTGTGTHTEKLLTDVSSEGYGYSL